MTSAPATSVRSLDLLGAPLRDTVLRTWNSTSRELGELSSIQGLFEKQVDRAPDETALIHADHSISYRELDHQSNRLAHHLRSLGVGPDDLVGVHLPRGIDLVVATVAVLKSGGAYLPLDPAYPRDRLLHMITDSGCRVVLTHQALLGSVPLPDSAAVEVLGIDTDLTGTSQIPTGRVSSDVQPHHLAYCIYTSGSTGSPKGVLVEHRNVLNFFTAMDDVVDHALPATWLAVTSLSFDISVLELLYTLTRGFTVVVHDDWQTAVSGAVDERNSQLSMDFSLFYFSGDEAESSGADKYRLLLEGARWADSHGFCAVWTPERHFHAFGGLYPQPAITGAAVAAVTSRIAIRAGSVVMPLHHPIRVAEAWSIVDNLSNGRVGISVASGWQPNDFVLAPHNYANAKEVMYRGLEQVQRLWRGEAVTFTGVDAVAVEVITLPRPVQPELPVWVTTAGNPDTYEQAGAIGANVLTHLLGQSIDELAPKIVAYRRARRAAGFDPASGKVTLMLHTFVGDDSETIRATVREPLKRYLATSLSLLREYASTFPAFRKPKDAGRDWDDEFADLSDDERDALLDHAFQRYYESSGLFGTPGQCRHIVDRLKGIGVDEIACLIDFGVGTDDVLAALPHLDQLRQQSNAHADQEAEEPRDRSFANQVERHRVTHLQCTPSMARMLTMDGRDRTALSTIQHLFIGGEALPVALASELRSIAAHAQITNMYGPTETTIWSTTWPLGDGPVQSVPIGNPVANTTIYVLDSCGMPQPPGVPGALWIGGAGVARGYHGRPDLTAERFVDDPFSGDGARMYSTGDIARWRTHDDGSAVLEFLGRADTQVKLRGYRIELGEVETELGRCRGVRECAASVVHDTKGEQLLIAYVTGDGDLEAGSLKDQLRSRLPDVMVPAHVVLLPQLPHTPNGKIDRAGLPWPIDTARRHGADISATPAASDVERRLLGVWREVLEIEGIGVTDNFFDIGGHSLLVVRLHRLLKEVLSTPVSLTDLYRFPTIRSLSESLASDPKAATSNSGVDRATKRREIQRRRSRQ